MLLEKRNSRSLHIANTKCQGDPSDYDGVFTNAHSIRLVGDL